MIGNISLDQYLIFSAVIEEGSMSKAAEKLHIGQPAVSMAIQKMEGYFNLPLFIRSKGGTLPTPEGSLLYDHLSKAFHHLRLGEAALEKMHQLEAGTLRIGASDTLSAGYLLPFFFYYHQDYPHIHLQVTNRPTPETLSLLHQGVVDIGFINLPVPEDPRFDIQPCYPIQDILIGSAAFYDLKKGIHLKELENQPLLMLEPISSTRQYLDTYALGYGYTLTPSVELGSSELLVAFAKINLGIAFVIKEFTTHYLGSTLFEIPLIPPIPPRSIGLVRRKNLPLSTAGQAFVSLIEKNI